MTAEELQAHAAAINEARRHMGILNSILKASVINFRYEGQSYSLPMNSEESYAKAIRQAINSELMNMVGKVAQLENAVMWRKDAAGVPIKERLAPPSPDKGWSAFSRSSVERSTETLRSLCKEMADKEKEHQAAINGLDVNAPEAEIQWSTQDLTRMKELKREAKAPDLPQIVNLKESGALQRFHDCDEPDTSAVHRVPFTLRPSVTQEEMIDTYTKMANDPRTSLDFAKSGFRVKVSDAFIADLKALALQHCEAEKARAGKEKVIAEEGGERIVVRREPIPTPPECSSDSGPLVDTESGK